MNSLDSLLAEACKPNTDVRMILQYLLGYLVEWERNVLPQESGGPSASSVLSAVSQALDIRIDERKGRSDALKECLITIQDRLSKLEEQKLATASLKEKLEEARAQHNIEKARLERNLSDVSQEMRKHTDLVKAASETITLVHKRGIVCSPSQLARTVESICEDSTFVHDSVVPLRADNEELRSNLAKTEEALMHSAKQRLAQEATLRLLCKKLALPETEESIPHLADRIETLNQFVSQIADMKRTLVSIGIDVPAEDTSRAVKQLVLDSRGGRTENYFDAYLRERARATTAENSMLDLKAKLCKLGRGE